MMTKNLGLVVALGGAVLGFGIVTLIGFALGAPGALSAVGGLFATIAGSMLCCCGPKEPGKGACLHVAAMVMSILERYREIGIMKAVGASDADVQKIFMFEAGTIGFFGGVFGLTLGWAVSSVINAVINVITSRQGVPAVDYFSFPWWLCLGAIAFSVLVSLLAGIYPTMRAARVDPVTALRHD